ncbi:MAG: hypothetical protein K8L91_31545 [Anaerolineae bacterium]|nr:hypothetical protein [Anaerolineae bacterium]
MTDLHTVIQALESFNRQELAEVERAIKSRWHELGDEPSPSDSTPEERIALMEAAVDDFWANMTPEEAAEAIAAMNEEYLEPLEKIDKDFAWIDALPEDER